MTQTYGQIRQAFVWVMRANQFELRLRNILAWLRQKGTEAQGRSVDLRAATALPDVATIAYDRRLPSLAATA